MHTARNALKINQVEKSLSINKRSRHLLSSVEQIQMLEVYLNNIYRAITKVIYSRYLQTTCYFGIQGNHKVPGFEFEGEGYTKSRKWRLKPSSR